MITKNQFCWWIINKFKSDNSGNDNITIDSKAEDLVQYIYSSSSLGVALQHLGYITPGSDADLYLSNRGGVFVTYTAFQNDKYRDAVMEKRTENIPEKELFGTLTMREILEMLPDTID